MELLKILRKGVWRGRKISLLVAVISILGFMVYVQVMYPGTIAAVVDSERAQSRDLLHSFNENEAYREEMAKYHSGVKVLPGDKANQNENDVKSDFKELKEPKATKALKNSLKSTQEATETNEVLAEERSKRALNKPKDQKLNGQIIDTTKSHSKSLTTQAPHIGSQTTFKTSTKAGTVWNAGTYRYNPYGEPVYNHGNRPNYIPTERVVHLDLKGAPPLPSVYKTLFPWMAKYGATAVLMEYEDMFPWEGTLAPFAAKNHYTKENIRDILATAEENNLKIIPLVQTFGHLEFVLKQPKYSYLREVPTMPQALCPSQKDSYWLVRELVDQIMSLHPNASFLHIGCDEVFQIRECNLCRLHSSEDLFLRHVSRTAKYVRNKYKIIPIIWHDMLIHVSESTMHDFGFGELVEPMVWVYAEDIYRFVQPSVWSKFSSVFPTVWAASAFKGAFGEQSLVPNVQRHLDNNLNWLDVMFSEELKFSKGFRGLVLTGWQRHDHFAVLCELIPSSLPSLAVNLIADSHGFFNFTLISDLYEALNCMRDPKSYTALSLDSDPFLWEKFKWCFFPGAQIFKATSRLHLNRIDVRELVDRITLKRGWISDYNRRHNFSSPMRINEDLDQVYYKLRSLKLFLNSTRDALLEWFDEWTTGEWLEQQLWPLIHELDTLYKEAESMKLVKTWPVRPLPLLSQLEEFGIKAPVPTTVKFSNSSTAAPQDPPLAQ